MRAVAVNVFNREEKFKQNFTKKNISYGISSNNIKTNTGP